MTAVLDSAETYEAYRRNMEIRKKENQRALFQAVDGWERNIIFGAGSDGTNLQAYLKMQNHDRTEAFCDNAKEKWGMSLNGAEVIGPSELEKRKDRLVLVASKLHSSEIREQLVGLGVDPERIYICDVAGIIPSYL